MNSLSVGLAALEPGGLVEGLWDEAFRLVRSAINTIRAADEVLGPVFRFLGVVVAFFSGVVAIYLKLRYAETRLHLRFQEFLEREENRLALANKQLDMLIRRPGPDRAAQSPIFVAPDLLPKLREMEFGRLTLHKPFEGRMGRAESELTLAIDELDQQLALWSLQKRCYERKKAQAHLVRGAIAATRAARHKERQESDRDANLIALREFKAATGVDPQKLQSFEDEEFGAFERADIQALEYVGHLHFRLGNPTLALQYFRKCHALANRLGASDPEALLQCIRALRHQAEILEWQDTPMTLDQARSRLTEAIQSLPNDKIDGIEGAELYELLGRVQKKRFLMGVITSREARRAYTSAEQRYANLNTPKAARARQRVRTDRESLPPDQPAPDEPALDPG